MKRVGLSIGTGSFLCVTDVIPQRLSSVILINEFTISGDDAHLRCYGAKQDDTIFWKRFPKNMTVGNILGTWNPHDASPRSTVGLRYFFDSKWSNTLYIKGAVAKDAGMYGCATNIDPDAFGPLTILGMYALKGYRAFRRNA